MDLCIACLASLLLSPLLIPIAFILRFTGEGEVFFFQRRIGYQNQEYFIWKFVTMRKDSPSLGTITAKGDPRILPVGKFLRDTKINELPQLINVLKGEMSIVGPRPLTEESFNLYPEELKPLVYQTKVGVTGIGSVVFRNEEQILADSEKNYMQRYAEDIMPIKGALEVWYAQNISFLTDVKIIILTAISIFFPANDLHTKWFKDLPLPPA